MKNKRIPRGPAATAAKNRYRDKSYDRAEILLPKGMKDQVKEEAEKQGKSLNAYISEAITEKMEKEK